MVCVCVCAFFVHIWKCFQCLMVGIMGLGPWPCGTICTIRLWQFSHNLLAPCWDSKLLLCCTLTDGDVQPEFITFLYQLIEGAAGRSYGLNVARLADIPDPILRTAARKARELENVVNARRYGGHCFDLYLICLSRVAQLFRSAILNCRCMLLKRPPVNQKISDSCVFGVSQIYLSTNGAWQLKTRSQSSTDTKLNVYLSRNTQTNLISHLC